MKIQEIIIESESKGPIIGGQESINDNSDIDIILEDGTVLYATAFTFKNIEWLRDKNIKTGECLNGRYFWAKNMLIVNKINRQEIEQIVNHLIQEGELESIFTKTDFSKSVWVFNSSNKGLPGGIFDNLSLAEKWIANNKLTGTLTKYPVNEGAFDWAIQNNMVNMKPEKLKVKAEDPDFIGEFTSASMEHYHYQDGHKE
jgi:hypothetical protein